MANQSVIYIVSDNGGSSEAGPEGTGAAAPLPPRLERMDELGTVAEPYNEYAGGWGLATNTPFQWSKQVASHLGSIRSPLVVSWPARIKIVGELRSQFTHVNDVAATLYEVTGIAFPTNVDGVEQKPLDGTSFAYSFDDPADLAQQYPEKLQALQALFDHEARENDVYPLGNLFNANETSWREALSPIAGKREFVYYPGTPRINRFAPDFSQSHSMEAQLEIAAGGAEGVILTHGGRHGGFALYIKDGRLVYENNFMGESRDVITSDLPLPRGKVTIAYELVREEDPLANTAKENPISSALLRLYINDQLAGEARLARIGQKMALMGSLGIGRAFGSPVSAHFKPPFEFTGTLNEVRVVMRGID